MISHQKAHQEAHRQALERNLDRERAAAAQVCGLSAPAQAHRAVGV